VWRVELTRGLRCLTEGNSARAEEHLQRAYRSAPERAEVCFALGHERLRQGQLEEAERLLRAAWSANHMLAAAAALARCLGAAGGRRAEAHLVLDEAHALAGDEPGLCVVRAELYLEDEDADRARAELERAERVLEREEREAPATQAAIRIAYARVWNLEGVSLSGRGRHDEALFAFKRAFDLDPCWSGPMVNMGAVFARLDRAARARACYERALVLDGDNAVARYNLAEICRQRGDVGTAEAEYRRLLDLDEAYPGARIALAELLCDAHRLDEALAVIASGPVKLEPAHVVPCCRVAERLAAAGKYVEAAELVSLARRTGADAARPTDTARPSDAGDP
jgi:tetratricopeptide (TPR) repeat protein